MAAKSLSLDLKNYNISDEIKDKANAIFSEMKVSTKRGKRRAQMVFFCIYHSYRELGQFQDPFTLASSLGLSKNDVNKALTMFSEIHTGYRPKVNEVTAIDLLPSLCREIGFGDDNIALCIEMATEIMNKDKELFEQYPKKVSAGMLEYYLLIQGAVYDKKEFSNKMGLSPTTIHTMVNRISTVHNS